MSRSSMSATEQAERASDKHIAVVCSDCEIRCISLPSQNTLYKERFNDSVFVVKAEAIIVKGTYVGKIGFLIYWYYNYSEVC